MSFGTTPISTTTLGANQFPTSAVAEPGLAGGNLTALEGGPGAVDGNGNRTAPASMYVKDGGDVALGTTTQTKATDATTTSWSTIQLLKGLLNSLLTTIAVTQSGTWTVQPGNTANTTAWKVDGSAVTQPVNGTVTANQGGAPWTVTTQADVLNTTAIAAGATGASVIKASGGTLGSILVTAAGTVAVKIYDNATAASGKVIGIIPATATVTGIPFVLNMPAANGITVGGAAGNPAVTISWK